MSLALEYFNDELFDKTPLARETVERLLLELPEEVVKIISLLRLVRFYLCQTGLENQTVFLEKLPSILDKAGMPPLLLEHSMVILYWILPHESSLTSERVESLEHQVIHDYFR
ncbi:MAG: hypothetical protein VX185_11270 [Pseudomonadota bacterium]|nr:hypothetical protein [Pseudomonadota bacterium]